jgi:hypothetical protein
MSQGCVLVLLLAMTLAMTAGVLAWGPIMVIPADHVFADQRRWGGIPSIVNVVAGLPMLGVSAWGARALWRNKAWPATMRSPWLAFFVLSALMSVTASIHHLDPSDSGYALVHAFAAGALLMLGLAFMTERVDALFGSVPSIIGGLAVAGCATLWWFAGQWASGHGDLRALLFFECLPLLLMPAGALGLDGRYTSASDWIATLGLYLVARAAGLADGVLYGATEGLSGHTLMHLLLAASAACLAYRASVASGSLSARPVAIGEPTQSMTSLNTSS